MDSKINKKRDFRCGLESGSINKLEDLALNNSDNKCYPSQPTPRYWAIIDTQVLGRNKERKKERKKKKKKKKKCAIVCLCMCILSRQPSQNLCPTRASSVWSLAEAPVQVDASIDFHLFVHNVQLSLPNIKKCTCNKTCKVNFCALKARYQNTGVLFGLVNTNSVCC